MHGKATTLIAKTCANYQEMEADSIKCLIYLCFNRRIQKKGYAMRHSPLIFIVLEEERLVDCDICSGNMFGAGLVVILNDHFFDPLCIFCVEVVAQNKSVCPGLGENEAILVYPIGIRIGFEGGGRDGQRGSFFKFAAVHHRF